VHVYRVDLLPLNIKNLRLTCLHVLHLFVSDLIFEVAALIRDLLIEVLENALA
jgi:hypothetical protein